jgi:hypothetical protein
MVVVALAPTTDASIGFNFYKTGSGVYKGFNGGNFYSAFWEKFCSGNNPNPTEPANPPFKNWLLFI